MSQPTIPSTIRTLVHNPKTHELTLENRATPVPPSDEHLIKVHTVALTAGELYWGIYDNHDPAVPATDVTGTIVTPLEGSPFKVGDVVYGRVDATRPGCAREYATALPQELALLPADFDKAIAVTVPMSAETAWQSLFEHGGLTEPTDDGEPANTSQPQKRVLVTAASGGVGLWAIQLAKLSGAYVVGTCSTRNVEFVKSLGADHVIDYTKSSITEYVKEDPSRVFDVVLDCKGGAALTDAWPAVKAYGVLVSIVPGFEKPETGVAEGVKSLWFIVTSSGKQLEKITRFIQLGKAKGNADSVYPLEEYAEAFKRVASGHARGKVVLQI